MRDSHALRGGRRAWPTYSRTLHSCCRAAGTDYDVTNKQQTNKLTVTVNCKGTVTSIAIKMAYRSATIITLGDRSSLANQTPGTHSCVNSLDFYSFSIDTTVISQYDINYIIIDKYHYSTAPYISIRFTFSNRATFRPETCLNESNHRTTLLCCNTSHLADRNILECRMRLA